MIEPRAFHINLTIELTAVPFFVPVAKCLCEFPHVHNAWRNSNFQVIVKSNQGNFYGLAVYADFIYWSDWARRSVLRSDKYTGGDVKVLRADIPHQPMGIIAVARDTNNCEYLRNGRVLWECT